MYACRRLSAQELHFVDAPHVLPLGEGQQVAMRAWWRHWNLEADLSSQASKSQQQLQVGPGHASAHASAHSPVAALQAGSAMIAHQQQCTSRAAAQALQELTGHSARLWRTMPSTGQHPHHQLDPCLVCSAL